LVVGGALGFAFKAYSVAQSNFLKSFSPADLNGFRFENGFAQLVRKEVSTAMGANLLFKSGLHVNFSPFNPSVVAIRTWISNLENRSLVNDTFHNFTSPLCVEWCCCHQMGILERDDSRLVISVSVPF
jgi:hypothetical protein